MLYVILFLLCAGASSIGSLVGAGGGVIIKPVLDLFGLMPVKTASFCSGCTALCMSLVSLLSTRGSAAKLDFRTSTPLAIGAVVGGFAGKSLMDLVSLRCDAHILGGVQAICLTLVSAGILLYVMFKKRLRSLHASGIPACVTIGFFLGAVSSFLGIGGGPANVAVLFFFFSMNAHTAARNSIYIIVFSQLASLATTFVTGRVPDVSVFQLVCMAAGGISGALIGGKISKKIPDRGVEIALNALLVFMIGVNLYNAAKFFAM